MFWWLSFSRIEGQICSCLTIRMQTTNEVMLCKTLSLTGVSQDTIYQTDWYFLSFKMCSVSLKLRWSLIQQDKTAVLWVPKKAKQQ